jgi:hypothetical protein
MAFSGVCVIQIAGDKYPPQRVKFSFSDEDVGTLNGFLREAEMLDKSMVANGGFPVSLNLSARVGQPVTISSVEPSDDERAIFLHRMRPFQLQDERYHFGRVRNIVARGTPSSDFLRSYLKQLKAVFSGATMRDLVRVSLGEATLNSEAFLDAWLNASEYHRDDGKLSALLNGRQPPDDSYARPILMFLLRNKIDAVLALGSIIERILRSRDETAA